MRLTLIAAVADNGVIGREGDLPWRLRADLRHFKARTLGHPIVMGRKTWESLPKRPLRKRLNVVLSRSAGYEAPGATVVPSVADALEVARASGAQEAFVIGGASIYADALPLADRLVITHVQTTVDGDAWFPAVDWAAWDVISEEAHAADGENEHAFRVVEYTRAQSGGGA